jgi:hypothetical protein
MMVLQNQAPANLALPVITKIYKEIPSVLNAQPGVLPMVGTAVLLVYVKLDTVHKEVIHAESALQTVTKISSVQTSAYSAKHIHSAVQVAQTGATACVWLGTEHHRVQIFVMHVTQIPTKQIPETNRALLAPVTRILGQPGVSLVSA